MKRARLSWLPPILAGVYFVWALFAYFATLGTASHAWWPILLYLLIWPLSALFHLGDDVVVMYLVPDARLAAKWVWDVNDYVLGALYIIGGTAWLWGWGKAISALATRFFSVK
jgi:hypothetical protein